MKDNKFSKYSEETKDIISKMLKKDPKLRMSPSAALKHSFFQRNGFFKLEPIKYNIKKRRSFLQSNFAEN